MHNFCSSQVPNFKIDRYPKSKFDVGGGLSKIRDRKKPIKKCKGGCSCDIDSYVLHMSDQLPHGATKFQKRLKAKHDSANRTFTSSTCMNFAQNSSCESDMNNVEYIPERKPGGFDEKCSTEKVEETCAEFLNIVQEAVLESVQKCLRIVLKENLERVERKVDAICTHVVNNINSLEDISKDFTKQMNKMNLKNDVRFQCLCEFLFEHIGNKDTNENESGEQLEKDETEESPTEEKKEIPARVCICQHIKTDFVDVVPVDATSSRRSTNKSIAEEGEIDMDTSKSYKSNSLESANNLKERLQSLKENRALRESKAMNAKCQQNSSDSFVEQSTSKGCGCNNLHSTKKSTSLRCSANLDLNNKVDKVKKSRKLSSRGTTKKSTSGCCCCCKDQNKSTREMSGKDALADRSITFNDSIGTCCNHNSDDTIEDEEICICKEIENMKCNRRHGGFNKSFSSSIPDTAKINNSRRCFDHLQPIKSTDIPQINTDDVLRVCVRERERRQERLTSPYNTPYVQCENINYCSMSNQPDVRVVGGIEKSSHTASSEEQVTIE